MKKIIIYSFSCTILSIFFAGCSHKSSPQTMFRKKVSYNVVSASSDRTTQASMQAEFNRDELTMYMETRIWAQFIAQRNPTPPPIPLCEPVERCGELLFSETNGKYMLENQDFKISLEVKKINKAFLKELKNTKNHQFKLVSPRLMHD